MMALHFLGHVVFQCCDVSSGLAKGSLPAGCATHYDALTKPRKSRERTIPARTDLCLQTEEPAFSQWWKDKLNGETDQPSRHPFPASGARRGNGALFVMAELFLRQLRVLLRWQVCVAGAMLICSLLRTIG